VPRCATIWWWFSSALLSSKACLLPFLGRLHVSVRLHPCEARYAWPDFYREATRLREIPNAEIGGPTHILDVGQEPPAMTLIVGLESSTEILYGV
jgi:hypothetical protein